MKWYRARRLQDSDELAQLTVKRCGAHPRGAEAQVVLDALQRCRSRGNRTARPADGAVQWLAVQRKEGMDGKKEGGMGSC